MSALQDRIIKKSIKSTHQNLKNHCFDIFSDRK